VERSNGKVTLMPGEHQPTLPPLEKLVTPEYVNPTRPIAPPPVAPPVVLPTPTTPFGETPVPKPQTGAQP